MVDHGKQEPEVIELESTQGHKVNTFRDDYLGRREANNLYED